MFNWGVFIMVLLREADPSALDSFRGGLNKFAGAGGARKGISDEHGGEE